MPCVKELQGNVDCFARPQGWHDTCRNVRSTSPCSLDPQKNKPYEKGRARGKHDNKIFFQAYTVSERIRIELIEQCGTLRTDTLDRMRARTPDWYFILGPPLGIRPESRIDHENLLLDLQQMSGAGEHLRTIHRCRINHKALVHVSSRSEARLGDLKPGASCFRSSY